MITEALTAYAARPQRRRKRNQTIGASEIGQCARKTYFARRSGMTDEDFIDSSGAALRGQVYEKFWVRAMRACFGDRLQFAGSKQVTFVDDDLSATPDGLLIKLGRDALVKLGIADIGESRSVVLDCKSIDPRIQLDGPRAAHFFQVQVQLGAVRCADEVQARVRDHLLHQRLVLRRRGRVRGAV